MDKIRERIVPLFFNIDRQADGLLRKDVDYGKEKK